MKRIVIILFIQACCFLLQAQTGWEKPVQVFTPNAASLGTYGQVPVNYFNGLAQTSIPLTTFKVNGYELPITLSYYAGGNKPDSHPGWVGLGWNLFAGGSINRIVNGIKDETTRSEVNYRFPTQLYWTNNPGYYYRMDSLNRADWSSRNYLRYVLLERITNTILLANDAYTLDTEPDEFQVSVGDISASFYLASNNTVKIKSKSNCNFKIDIKLAALSEVSESQVDYAIISDTYWGDLTAKCFTYIKEIILTNNDGIKYYFGGDKSAIEFSFARNGRDLFATANTWHLKKIITPNGETIELDYEKKGIPIIENNNRYVNEYYRSNKPSVDSSNTVLGHRAYTIIQPSYLKSIQSPTSGRTMTFKRSKSTELGYNIDPYFFNQIFGNDITSKLFAYRERLLSDSSNYYMKLDSIIDTNKKIALNYTSSSDTRLKLDNIVFSDSKNSRINGYLFDYNSTDLPPYNSKMADNWGYYNNKYYGVIPYANLEDFRTADSTYMKAEILTKITYPTGGTTEFVYEPHDYSKKVIHYPFTVENNYNNYTLMCGGLRIKKMINRDTNNHTTIREFEYKNEQGNSSGILSSIPIYDARGTTYVDFGDIHYNLIDFSDAAGLYYGANTTYYRFGNEQIQNQLSNANGNPITYSRVTEKLSDGSKTIYNYTNQEKYPDQGADLSADNVISSSLPCNTFISYELERGLLESVEYYKNTVPVKKEIYTYNSNPNRYNDFFKSINLYGFSNAIRAIPLKTFTFAPYLQSKTETTYDINGNNPVISTTNYRYNDYRLPYFQSQSGSRSAADSVAVVTKYPFDNNGAPYSTMTQKFMLNYPVETIKYKGNSIIEGKLTTYKQVTIANDTLYVPDKAFSTEITTPLTSFSYFNGTTKDSHYGLFPDMELVKYGPKGNIYEIKDRKGISTTYLWGYSYQNPIAEIKNATYPQIETELGSSYISNLANNPNPSVSDLTNLNSLRTSSNLPGIEVSTFTYKPFVGMISKTDPRGVSINYTYDTFGRLILNQDDNSKILARYDYSYHDNGPGYALSVSLKPAPFYVQNVTDSVPISVKGASGNYSYNWVLLDGTTVLATSNSKNFNISCSQAGKLTVTCTVTDNVTGRKIEKKKTITCYSKPSLTVTPDASYYMINTAGNATASATGGSGDFSYDWAFADDSGYSHDTGTTFNFTSSHSGDKALVCTVTDNLTKQTKNVTMLIPYYTSFPATLTTEAWHMFNDKGTATVTTGIGDSNNYSYTWLLKNSSGTVLQNGTDSTSFSYTCSQADTLTVECTVKDKATEQSYPKSVEVISYTVPTATVSTGATWYIVNGIGTASVSAGGGSGNYSYAWKLKNSGDTVLQSGTNSTSFSYTCSQAGTLTVECTVTDNITGQTVTNTKTITSYSYPTATVSTGATWYMVNGTGTASVTAGGGSSNYSYAWKLKNSGGTVLQSGTNSTSFSYTCSQSDTLRVECTVTDNLTGQSTTQSTSITVYTYPTATVSTGATWYMVNGTGTASVSVGGFGSGEYTYAWKLKNKSGTVLQNGTNASTFNYSCSQSDTLTVECTVTDNRTTKTVTNTKKITVYTDPTATVNTGATWYIINGTGTASVSVGGFGSGEYTYAWKLKNKSGTVLQNGTNASTFNYSCSQSDTLMVECTVTDNRTTKTVTNTKKIKVYTNPTVSVSTGATWYMVNGTGTASASAGAGSGSYSYSWKLKNSGGTVLQSGTNSTSFSYTCSQSGTLTVECTVTDNVTGQTVTNTKTISSYTYPTATVSTGATWYMINGTGTASVSAGAGSGNYSYAWTLKNSGGTVLQNGTNSASFIYTCSQAGTLTVECTVTDNVTGQTITNSKNVTSYTYPAASVTVGSTWLIINGGNTANVSGSGGSGNYSYAWRLKNSGGTVLQTGTNSASYYYTCSQSGTITVECTVTDNVTGQTATDSKTFICYTYPTASVATGGSRMLNGTGTASVSAGAGSGGYSYSWTLKNSSGTVLQNGTNSTSFSYTCSQSGTLTVECTVTDNLTGQSTTQSTPITIYTYPTATVSTGATWYMVNNPGTASVSAGGGSIDYTYTWRLKNSSGTVLQTGTNYPSFTYTCSQSGTLTVECTVTDNVTGQSISNSKTISSYTYPTAGVSTGATWYMVNGTGTASVNAGAGSGNYSYAWKLKNSGGTVLQTGSNSSAFSYTCSQSGTLTVECTVTDNVTGQTVSNTKTVTSYTYPTAVASTGATWYMVNGTGTASVSAGDGSGGYSYAWRLKNSGGTVLQNGTNSTSFSYTCSQAGTLTVECTATDNVTGQTVTNSKNVTSYTYPAAGVTVGSTWIIINGGSTANASGSGGSGNYSYAWRLKNSGGTVLQNGTNSASFYYTCPQSGTMTVECTVTDNVTAQAATNSNTFTSYTYPTASVSIGSSTYLLNATGTASVSAGAGSGSYSYSWKLKNSGGTVLQSGTNSTSFSYTCSQLGTLTVECTVTDLTTGQAVTDSRAVSVYNPLSSTVSTGANWYILNSTVTASETAGGGSGNYGYSWFINGSPVTGTSSSLSFTCSSVGTNVISCTVTDNVTGQTVTGNKTVSCYTVPTATLSVGASSYTQNDTGSATVSASGGSGTYSYAWSLLSGSTVLANGSNSSSFSFTCSQVGTLTVRCIVTDNVTGQTKTVTQNITCTSAVLNGNFTLQSGYSNYYNSLSKTGSTVSFVLAFGLSYSAMNPGVSYYVATVPTGFRPSTTRTVTIDSYGNTWSLTFNSNGTVYCQIVYGSSFPVGSGVNLSGSYNL